MRYLFHLVFCHNYVGEGTDSFDCVSVCFGPYQLGQDAVTSCDVVDAAFSCYVANQEACDANNQVPFLIGQASDSFVELDCVNAGQTDTAPTTVTSSQNPSVQPMSCPSVPDVYNVNPSVTMNRPKIEPPSDLPTLCSMPPSPSHAMRQCSLFMDSQLRAFSGYRRGLEACSIPGTWYLLNHRSMSIEVEGTNLEPGSDHTRLTKINVTFNANSCNNVVRSYVAEVSSPLPSDFIPPFDNFTSSTSSSLPLQLASDSNGSVVTLLATWLKTTIIIRQYANFLSITIQVPGELSNESEGLCRGCPPHMYVNITHFNNQVPSMCPDDNNRALVNCFQHAGVANQDHLFHVTNNTYLDACVYSMYKTKSVEVLSMFNAVADDAKLLVNVDPYTTQTPNTHRTTLPDQPQSSPADSNASSPAEQSSSCSLLSSPLLILLTSLLLVR